MVHFSTHRSRMFLLLLPLFVFISCAGISYGSDEMIKPILLAFSDHPNSTNVPKTDVWEKGGASQMDDAKWEDEWNDEDGDMSQTDKEEWDEEWDDKNENTDTGEDIWEDEANLDSGGEKNRFELKGEVLNKLAYDLDEENEFESDTTNHAELLAGVSMIPNDQIHAVLFVDVDYFSYGNDGDWEEDGSIRLHDAYLNLRGEGYNLKLGNQIVRWGKTDGYSPLDNLNPEDFRDDLAGRREDRKLPIPMVNLEIYTDSVTISGVYIPFFIRPELDLQGTDWSLLGIADQQGGTISITEEDPSHSLKNSEGGIRLSGISGSMDWAFSWLYAREDMPAVDTLTLPPGVPVPSGGMSISSIGALSKAGGQPIHLTHDRQNIFGVEIETTMSSFGVRGDLAYFDNSSFFTGELKRIRKPVVQIMVGIDYSGTNAWYANIQLFQSYIHNYDNRIIWAEETVSALNGTLWKEFKNGEVKAECRFYYDISGNATMLNPKIRLSTWEPVIFEIGVEWFDGSDETVIGRFDANDQIYASMEFKF